MEAEKDTGKKRSQKAEHHLIFERFYLVPSREMLAELSSSFKYFSIAGVLSYHAFYDDFGPMDLKNVSLFCSILDEQLKQYPDKLIALKSSPDRRTMTNSVFLIGSYMILRMGFNPDEVLGRFEGLQHRLATFRDILPGKQNFDLHVRDCWGGLWRAKSLRWVEDEDGIDPCDHDYYSSSMHGYLHVMVPGKFVGMRGPRDLPDGAVVRDVRDEENRVVAREFGPAYYLSILRRLGVQARARPRRTAAAAATATGLDQMRTGRMDGLWINESAGIPTLCRAVQGSEIPILCRDRILVDGKAGGKWAHDGPTLGGQAVVRLHEPEYDAEVLRRGGIAVADLPFEDCTTPPADVVGKWGPGRAVCRVYNRGSFLRFMYLCMCAEHCAPSCARTSVYI